MKAEILTPWAGSGTEDDPFRPLVSQVLKGKIRDVTYQPSLNLPTEPNLLIVEVECTPAALAEVESDPRFQIIWSE